jgi:hypothetical protein
MAFTSSASPASIGASEVKLGDDSQVFWPNPDHLGQLAQPVSYATSSLRWERSLSA